MNRSGKALAVRLLLTLGAALLIASAAFAQDQTTAPGEKKAKHVITEEDLNSGRPVSGISQASPSNVPSSQADGATKTDADAATSSDPAATTDAGSDEEMSKHQAGGPIPNEKPADAIKRIEREENELRSKLDTLQQKADSEKSENRRRMWLEAIDRQQTTLQQMRDERNELQKSEDAKAAAGGTASEAPAAESGAGTTPR